MMIDCHIHQPRFANLDYAAFQKEAQVARDLGVRAWIMVGTTVDESTELLALITDWPDVYACVGVHPTRADSYTSESLEKISALAQSSDKVIGIGEVGLDYERTDIPRDVQRKVFREQIRLARELNLPLNMHTYGRPAANELIDVLEEEKAYEVGGILHNFMGNADMIRRLGNMGIFVSVSVVLMHPGADRLRAVLRDAPLSNLVMDTDWPVATLDRNSEEDYPFDMDKVCELRNLHRFAERLAAERKIPVEHVADVTGLNAVRAFPRLAARMFNGNGR